VIVSSASSAAAVMGAARPGIIGMDFLNTVEVLIPLELKVGLIKKGPVAAVNRAPAVNCIFDYAVARETSAASATDSV